MAIIEVSDQGIRELDRTTFAREALRERDDLQQYLKKSIDTISPDTVIIAEEYGSWAGSLRRIDLLGLDAECNLVVIELKRTEDGGHMELQAIRYAAMVSSLTFDDVVSERRAYLQKNGMEAADVEAELLEFLGLDEAPALSESVRIVLAAADFSKELVRTVLWLNAHSLDIRCVRMSPYAYGQGRVLLDVQQVVPLPEAQDYVFARDRKELEEARIVKRNSAIGRDYTKFDLTVGSYTHQRLSKREFVFHVVQEAIRRGHTPVEIRRVITSKGNGLFAEYEGNLNEEAFANALTQSTRDPRRFFCREDQLFRTGDRTYALTNQWGEYSQRNVDALIEMMGKPASVHYTARAPD